MSSTPVDGGRGGGLVEKYWARLQLDPSKLDQKPTLRKLQAIHEAHLKHIPFENLSQHGCGSLPVLDTAATAAKILTRHRGGFCLELNGLLAEFLTELGYQTVTRVPAFVYRSDDKIFAAMATHMFLIVECIGSDEDNAHQHSINFSSDPHCERRLCMVDVGFGEPPLHPLQYGTEFFGKEQVTPEGMRSKFVREGQEDSSEVIMFWYDFEADCWLPRLKWSYSQSMLGNEGPSLDQFSETLTRVLSEESNFSKKLIVSILKRDVKLTLAGNRLKITGPPRFPTGKKIICEVDSVQEIREILQDRFGIPLHETSTIDINKSLVAQHGIWEHC